MNFNIIGTYFQQTGYIMRQAGLENNIHIRNSNEYSQCAILWRKLPAVFKLRWKSEAERVSTSGYKLFIKTNMNNLISGDEIKIAPWH